VIDEALTRFPGVYRRTDSSIFQFGLRVPKDLAGLYSGDWAVRCSLKTADLREANSKAKELHKYWEDIFGQQRTGTPPPAPRAIQAPPDLTKLRAQLLRQLESMLDGMDTRIATYTPENRQERARELQWVRADTQQGLECGYVPDWQVEWLDTMSRSLGLPRSPIVDSELLKHYVAMQDVQIEAMTDLTGTYPVRVSTLADRRRLLPGSFKERGVDSAADVVKGSGPPRLIADALELWKRAAPRLQKTVETFERHAAMFADMMGNPPVNQWNRGIARDFRDALTSWAQREAKTARTADNVRVSISAIAEAARAQDWLAANPFSGFAVTQGGKESLGREPWTHSELEVLFDDPIWRGKALPAAAKAGAAAAYWMPLIACYSGARISEIAQLWTDDLETGLGAECIEFRANKDRQQKLKNLGSWRAVPMHTELIRLGLPAYARSLPAGPLFPELSRGGKNGPGGVFGVWFGTFKVGKGFDKPSKAFHSFRHLVSTELQLKNVSEALRNSILGHTGEGMGEKVYGATVRRHVQGLRPYVNTLVFPLTSLPAFDWA
jgi:integrase